MVDLEKLRQWAVQTDGYPDAEVLAVVAEIEALRKQVDKLQAENAQYASGLAAASTAIHQYARLLAGEKS